MTWKYGFSRYFFFNRTGTDRLDSPGTFSPLPRPAPTPSVHYFFLPVYPDRSPDSSRCPLIHNRERVILYIFHAPYSGKVNQRYADPGKKVAPGGEPPSLHADGPLIFYLWRLLIGAIFEAPPNNASAFASAAEVFRPLDPVGNLSLASLFFFRNLHRADFLLRSDNDVATCWNRIRTLYIL